MYKKILLIFLLLISVCLAGCTSEPEPIEYEIMKVDVVESIDKNTIQKYDFDIVYIDDKGYIQYASTSKKDIYNYVKLRQSYDDEYRLFWVDTRITDQVLELHIPKNMTLIL